MFDKCIKCDRIGESCVPNFMLLHFADLMQWCNKRQKYLGWSNQTLAEKSKIPVGTINRIKGGEEDCKYSTIHSILIALIGGTTDEFACTEQVEKELKHTVAETENEMLKNLLSKIDEQHRNDIRVIKAEYQAQIDFLKEELKAWRSLHTK